MFRSFLPLKTLENKKEVFCLQWTEMNWSVNDVRILNYSFIYWVLLRCDNISLQICSQHEAEMFTRALGKIKLWSTETCSSWWSWFYNTHSCSILLIFLSEILFSREHKDHHYRGRNLANHTHLTRDVLPPHNAGRDWAEMICLHWSASVALLGG